MEEKSSVKTEPKRKALHDIGEVVEQECINCEMPKDMRYEGWLVHDNDLEDYSEKFKYKGLYTCLGCGSTLSYEINQNS